MSSSGRAVVTDTLAGAASPTQEGWTLRCMRLCKPLWGFAMRLIRSCTHPVQPSLLTAAFLYCQLLQFAIMISRPPLCPLSKHSAAAGIIALSGRRAMPAAGSVACCMLQSNSTTDRHGMCTDRTMPAISKCRVHDPWHRCTAQEWRSVSGIDWWEF